MAKYRLDVKVRLIADNESAPSWIDLGDFIHQYGADFISTSSKREIFSKLTEKVSNALIETDREFNNG